jgi:hypothetical protein
VIIVLELITNQDVAPVFNAGPLQQKDQAIGGN